MVRRSLIYDSVVKEHLLNNFSYDPITGKLVNKRTSKEVTSVFSTGYLRVNIRVGGRKISIPAHRVCWLIQTGKWPTMVDHINRIRSDNRWDNLREATFSENSANALYKNGSGLPRGVTKTLGYTFQARIQVRGRRINLGQFKTPEAASEAYELAFDAHFGSEWRPHESNST